MLTTDEIIEQVNANIPKSDNGPIDWRLMTDWFVSLSTLVAAGGGGGRDLASQAEAEAGTDNVKGMTPLRTSQAISALETKSDEVTLTDLGFKNSYAVTGLTTTQISSVWGATHFDVSVFTNGSYADDSLGSIINSGVSDAIAISFPSSGAPLKDMYVTTSINGFSTAQVSGTGGNRNMTEIGTIVTDIGTEYVYRLLLSEWTTAGNAFGFACNGGGSAFYARFWDANPMEYVQKIKGSVIADIDANTAKKAQPEDTNTPVAINTNITDVNQVIVSDTSGGALTHTLPASPTANRLVVFIGDATSETNNITISGNGNNISGSASLVITEEYGTKSLWYNGTEWKIIYGYENIWYIEDGQAKTRNGITMNANMISGITGLTFTPTGDDITGDVDTASPNDVVSTECLYTSNYWYQNGQDKSDYDGGYFLSTDATVKAGGARTLCLEFNLDSVTGNDSFFHNRSGNTGIMVLLPSSTTIDIYVGTGSALSLMNVTGVSLATDHTLVVVIPEAGTPKAYLDGGSAINGNNTTTIGMSTSAGTNTGFGVDPTDTARHVDGKIWNFLWLAGEATNPQSWDGTFGSLTGSLTKTIEAIDGNPQNATPTVTWSKTGTVNAVSDYPTVNNWIPYEVLPNPTTQVQTATLKVYDEASNPVGESNFNVMYSTDGGTVKSASYTPSAFRALGLLATSTNYRIYIQLVNSQKISSMEISENETILKVTDSGGVELLNNGVQKMELNELGQLVLADSTEPSTPVDGIVLYSEAEVLKYKTASGTIKTITAT